MKHTTLKMLALAMGAASLSSAANAGTPAAPATPAVESFSVCEWLPSRFDWFDAKRDNAENPYIQEFKAKFRAQYQMAWVEPAGDNSPGAASGNDRHYNSEWRRFRLGWEAKVFKHFEIENVWNIGGLQSRDEYDSDTGLESSGQTSGSLDTLKISAKLDPVKITVGKFKAAFLEEYATSSSKIKTIERSGLTNQLSAGKLWGISVANSDKKDALQWTAGVWMNGLHEDTSWTEPVFNSDMSAMFGTRVQYKISDTSKIGFTYMHSFMEGDDKGDVEDIVGDEVGYDGPGARDILSAHWSYKQGKFAMMTEVIGAFNMNEGKKEMAGGENMFGLIVLPTYQLTDNLELAGRFYMSSGSNVCSTYKRYYGENSTFSTYSDGVQALYLGLNYYICAEDPNAMKIMAGMEYTHSSGTDAKGDKGFTGWSFQTAFRVNF